MLSDALRRFDRRELALVLTLTFVTLAALIVITLVSPRYNEYKEISRAEAGLGDAAESSSVLGRQLAQLGGEVESLQRRLHGDMASMPEKQIEAHVIGRLQGIAWKNNIQLVGIEPTTGDTIDSFRELLFHVNLSGNYFEMYQWLQDVSDELGFVLIKQYEMRPLEMDAKSPRLSVKLTMATYRALQQ